jgi:cytochrome oxidase Cu insertion factor (SCO1/SenC/PrrC family)
VNASARAWGAVAALATIIAITASWWALALWPVGADAPGWILRTREVCFGSTSDALPNAGGWLLLVGQPAGMVVLLATVWGAELRAGLALAMARAPGQLAVGAALALVLAGLGATVIRVQTANVERFSTGTMEIATQLTRVSDAAPSLSLVDQSGREITLQSFRGRPVIVTFAFAHCQTVCPLIVSDVLAARRQIDGARPAVLIVTLDPWRDTPSRLPSIAQVWGLAGDAHVLSGRPDDVERTLNAWRVPRTRNQMNGDILHPSIVYVVAADGRIAYVLNGGADAISAAVGAL